MNDDKTTHGLLENDLDEQGARAYVALVEGNGPRVIKLPEGETISIGRSRSSGFPLNDNAVSRLHATLTWNGGDTVELIDCESRNGVQVEGRRIDEPLELVSGTELVIGSTRLVVFIRSDESECETDGEGRRPLVAVDAAMVRTVALVERAARSDATVLFSGETGSGKELLARRIHLLSARREGPFIAVNCGAITESIAESVLFGHEKGAFTGAAARHIGYFEQAKGGTLFLDEVGELSSATQVRLLRVLQEKELVRVGSVKPIEVDLRLVAATNADLEAKVRQNEFREDLLYRLDVIRINVPPLRQRPDDIIPLARQFLLELRPSRPCQLTRAAIDKLRAHRWPGNVRELRNVIERAVALCSGPTLDAHALEGLDADGPSRRGTLRAHVGDAERDAILAALEMCGGNQTHAAKRLGISRRSLIYKLERYGLKKKPNQRGD